MTPPTAQQVVFHPFRMGVVRDCLALAEPIFVRGEDAFRQLRYIESYAGELGCKSLVVERIYIDRDYIEDHSVFYSKSLHPYTNRCQRIHFLSFDEASAQQAIREILELGIREGERAYRDACRRLSDEAYLGFCVIKPLPGSPVGRTVLRCYPEEKDEPGDRAKRDFGCARNYSTHLLGVELSVRGLAFQQQDVGVSACATTAIWSALQKVRDHEDITAVTPAQITSLAGKYSLPFGRAMPSEGLSIDQMCQAVQAVGVSPNVFRTNHLTDTRAYIYSAVKSGIAPVLILSHAGGHHAVAVVGMKLRLPHASTDMANLGDDAAGDVIGFYIHDDRRGPYLRADLLEKGSTPYLSVPLRGETAGPEVWEITHILAPLHAKIRMSLADLRRAAMHVVANANNGREAIERSFLKSPIPEPLITFECWLMKSHLYLESMFLRVDSISAEKIEAFCSNVTVARYLGIVRLTSSYFDTIDVMIDTTGTYRNTDCLGVVTHKTSHPLTEAIASYLSKTYRCPLVV